MFTETYIDNIYRTGKKKRERVNILIEIFARLENDCLIANILECAFLKKQIKILRFLINKLGLSPTPSRVEAIKNASLPKNLKELKAFLAL